MKNPYAIVRLPYITEKSTIQKDDLNKIAFKVDCKANKIEIKKAIETIFKVKVKDVNTVRLTGKVKRLGRNEGKRPDWKKAIITLEKGAKIDFFEGA